jgi:hypothetical protein
LFPILFALPLLATLLKVYLVRPFGNVIDSSLGGLSRLGTRIVMCLLGNWHLHPFRLIYGCLHQNVLSFWNPVSM